VICHQIKLLARHPEGRVIVDFHRQTINAHGQNFTGNLKTQPLGTERLPATPGLATWRALINSFQSPRFS
jgi:hypothetical protein